MFNHQYNVAPAHLPIFPLLHRALASGVTAAFDTSPYYGPSEVLLGTALAHPSITAQFPRESYKILTKVGRVAGNCFDYSPAWIRRSVRRSLKRLRTDYLDVVYCHDVEFVSEEEVITAIQELRRIRNEEGSIKYVGISGYPVDRLCHLAERIKNETGEPLDIVQSYSNYNLQNTRLLSDGRDRLVNAGVDVVTNASLISMGLLRRNGVPVGSMGDWHPSPHGLREAVKTASDWLQSEGERLEVLALRFGLENWLQDGSALGTSSSSSSSLLVGAEKVGVSVIGVSHLDELEDVIRVWQEILDDYDIQLKGAGILSPADSDAEDASSYPPPLPSIQRRQRLDHLVHGVRAKLGQPWIDYTWSSPAADFERQPHVIRPEEDDEWANPDGQTPVDPAKRPILYDEFQQQEVERQLDIKNAIRAITRPVTPSSSSGITRR